MRAVGKGRYERGSEPVVTRAYDVGGTDPKWAWRTSKKRASQVGWAVQAGPDARFLSGIVRRRHFFGIDSASRRPLGGYQRVSRSATAAICALLSATPASRDARRECRRRRFRCGRSRRTRLRAGAGRSWWENSRSSMNGCIRPGRRCLLRGRRAGRVR